VEGNWLHITFWGDKTVPPFQCHFPPHTHIHKGPALPASVSWFHHLSDYISPSQRPLWSPATVNLAWKVIVWSHSLPDSHQSLRASAEGGRREARVRIRTSVRPWNLCCTVHIPGYRAAHTKAPSISHPGRALPRHCSEKEKTRSVGSHCEIQNCLPPSLFVAFVCNPFSFPYLPSWWLLHSQTWFIEHLASPCPDIRTSLIISPNVHQPLWS
jgi:hypothetical protein